MILGRVLIIGAALVAVGAVAKETVMKVTPPPSNFFAIKSYLAAADIPDGVALMPPPPAPGSAAEARDLEAQKAAIALRGTSRWELARRDADLFSPTVLGTYSCAANLDIGPKTTPKLAQLMLRAGRDLAMATRAPKLKYMRKRPFMVNGEPNCTPEMDKVLSGDGSYPSGHSAIGWGWGLLLSEVIPNRTTQLVARGRAFGDSRRVCNVHWLSDTEEGRIAADAVMARLHAEPAFLADVSAARAEAAAKAGKSPPQGCAAEAAALAMH